MSVAAVRGVCSAAAMSLKVGFWFFLLSGMPELMSASSWLCLFQVIATVFRFVLHIRSVLYVRMTDWALDVGFLPTFRFATPYNVLEGRYE